MRIFYKNLIKNIHFKNNILCPNSLYSNQHSNNTNTLPVKLAFNDFVSQTTNPNAYPLMVLHGFFGSKRNWRGRSIEIESKTKRKVYAIDVRNHGDSPHAPEHNLECMANDIAFLMQEEKLGKISLIGHSMGGRIAMHFALKYPTLVEKAIIIDISPLSTPENSIPIEKIIHALRNISLPSDLSLADGRTIIRRQLVGVAKVEKEITDNILFNLKKLKSGEFTWNLNLPTLLANFSQLKLGEINFPPFKGPILFIGAKRSNYIDPADWPKIKKLFPNAELKWLDTGHLVHFDQPEQFMDLVTNFLNS